MEPLPPSRRASLRARLRHRAGAHAYSGLRPSLGRRSLSRRPTPPCGDRALRQLAHLRRGGIQEIVVSIVMAAIAFACRKLPAADRTVLKGILTQQLVERAIAFGRTPSSGRPRTKCCL